MKYRLSILGGGGKLCLNLTNSIDGVWLLLTCGQLDHETEANYQLNLILKNSTDQNEVILNYPIHLDVLDVNDNAPKWNQSSFEFVTIILHKLL